VKENNLARFQAPLQMARIAWASNGAWRPATLPKSSSRHTQSQLEAQHRLKLSNPVYTIQPVVKPVAKPVSVFDNRLDKRLYRVCKHPTGY